jgi:hypothetical protein
MSKIEQFHIGEFLIHVDEGTYLVEVKQTNSAPSFHTIEDLPHWVFASRYAIWLTEGDAPIRDRAAEGERIKQRFIKQLNVA